MASQHSMGKAWRQGIAGNGKWSEKGEQKQ